MDLLVTSGFPTSKVSNAEMVSSRFRELRYLRFVATRCDGFYMCLLTSLHVHRDSHDYQLMLTKAILGSFCPAYERRRYSVTPSLNGQPLTCTELSLRSSNTCWQILDNLPQGMFRIAARDRPGLAVGWSGAVGSCRTQSGPQCPPACRNTTFITMTS